MAITRISLLALVWTATLVQAVTAEEGSWWTMCGCTTSLTGNR